MNEHDHPDIVDQIDALTEDAAGWSATGDHTHPWWSAPAAGAMTAIELRMSGAGAIDISNTDPGSDIAHRVGDPGVDPISHLRRVRFWVGGNSAATSPGNPGATLFLHRLLVDVRDGRYIASDPERDHARALLDAPDTLPVIHGTCLVTGVDDDGAAAPLDENFHDWFTGLLERSAHAFAATFAASIGISPGQVVLVHLS